MLEEHEALQQLIDDAWDAAQRLDLELVKFLLEMAKLELYREIDAAISSGVVERPHTGNAALPTLAIAAER